MYKWITCVSVFFISITVLANLFTLGLTLNWFTPDDVRAVFNLFVF